MPNPILAGSLCQTKAEFEKLKNEVSKRFNINSNSQEIKDNFLYVSKKEHEYRVAPQKVLNAKTGTFDMYFCLIPKRKKNEMYRNIKRCTRMVRSA